MICNQYIEKLLDRVEICDVIYQFTELKKTGSSFRARCPIHGGSNLNLSVSQDKQYFQCYKCGAYGNSIVFLRDMGYTFNQAVDYLSSMAGLAVEKNTQVVVPRKLKEALQMDRIIIKMSETPGNVITYADKQRVILARERLIGAHKKGYIPDPGLS